MQEADWTYIDPDAQPKATIRVDTTLADNPIRFHGPTGRPVTRAKTVIVEFDAEVVPRILRSLAEQYQDMGGDFDAVLEPLR